MSSENMKEVIDTLPSQETNIRGLSRTLNLNIPPPAEKIVLHDGVNQIRNISVLALYRNTGDYMRFASKQFSNWEARYDCQFTYYFLENDSKDDTREYLTKFFETHKGKLIAGKLDKDYVHQGENFNRTMTLAKLRNALVDAVVPLESEWTVFVDSNIFFPFDVLERFFAVEPAKNNIGMLTPYTKQIHTISNLKSFGINVKTPTAVSDNQIVELKAAFDTFSFHDLEGNTHYPHCLFQKCVLCATARPIAGNTLPTVPESPAVVDVMSAFSGFAVIQSDILTHPRIRWATASFDFTGKMSMCEHVFFCDRLRTVTGKKVVVVQDIDDLYRTY